MDNLSSEDVHLFDELRPQILDGNLGQILKLVLLGQRPDHGATVSVLEEGFEEAPNSILFVDCFAEAFLVLECLFQILFGGDGLLILVH